MAASDDNLFNIKCLELARVLDFLNGLLDLETSLQDLLLLAAYHRVLHSHSLSVLLFLEDVVHDLISGSKGRFILDGKGVLSFRCFFVLENLVSFC